MGGILGKVYKGNGIKAWHVIAVLVIAALVIYFMMGKTGEASMIGVKCWDQHPDGSWSQIDCKSGQPSAQTMALVTAPGYTSGSVDGISFVYTVNNGEESIPINVIVSPIICKTNPGAVTAPACDGPANVLTPATGLSINPGMSGVWDTGIVQVQGLVPADDLPDGNYRLTVTVTGTDPNGVVASSVVTQSLDFTNAHEIVSFSVGVAIT